jgi:hypothetical protein
LCHQVRPEGRPGSDPWGDRRSTGAFALLIVLWNDNGNADLHQRPERNETSITIVSRNDPTLSIPILEAEASGLLDRLLNLFQENSRSVRTGHEDYDNC